MKSKKGKMKSKSDMIYARKSKVIEKNLNPFDMQVRHDKFKVLNRKTSHHIGNPLLARQKAFERRKETIGAEYKIKNKSNKFEDKRRKGIGARKITKESIYNLNDSEILTHHGQTLEEVENFDDIIPDDDEMSDEEVRLDGNIY